MQSRQTMSLLKRIKKKYNRKPAWRLDRKKKHTILKSECLKSRKNNEEKKLVNLAKESPKSVQHLSVVIEKQLTTEILDKENIIREESQKLCSSCPSICEYKKVYDRVEENDGNHEKHNRIILVRNNNECSILKGGETMTQTKSENLMDQSVKEKYCNKDSEQSKEGKTLYCAKWLELSGEDFILVADTVDGVRVLFDKFCDDDDLPLKQRLENKKVRCSMHISYYSMIYKVLLIN